MLERRRLLTLCLGTCLVCTLGLYAYAWSVSPRSLPIGEIGGDDLGSLVRTQGHVKSLVVLDGGGVSMTLVDYHDFATIVVFISGRVAGGIAFLQDMVPGSMLRVTGEIQEFNGELEIAVSSPEAVELLAFARENRLDLSTLALSPEAFRGMHVQVGGRAEEITAIVDGGKVFIVSGGASIWADYLEGREVQGRVDVFAMVLYNEKRERYEVKVGGGSDGIAPHPSKIPEGYEAVTLDSLSSSPGRWEGMAVAVLNVSASRGEVIGTSFSIVEESGGGRYSISCMIFGWDSGSDDHGIGQGVAIEFYGVWDYYPAKAVWQIVSDEFTLRLLP